MFLRFQDSELLLVFMPIFQNYYFQLLLFLAFINNCSKYSCLYLAFIDD